VGTATLTFPVGSVDGATQTFNLGVLADTSVEGNETVNLQLGNVTGTQAALGVQTTHQATITDDDQATVAFQLATSATADETAGNHAVTVVLSVPSGTTPSAITVDVTDAGGGSATSGTDYSAVGTVTLTFPVGSADGVTQTFNLDVLADTSVEGNETVNLQLGNVTGTQAGLGAQTGAQTNHQATITDDDQATVAFQAAASATVDETAGNHAVTVVLSVPSGTTPSAVTVDVTDAGGGSATSGTDYSAVGTATLTFPVGSVDGATQTFDLGVLADTLVEGNETVNLQLGNVTGTQAALGVQTTHQATITDDDQATVAFQLASSATADETAGNHAVTVVLSVPSGTTPSAITVDVTDAGGGSATSGTDYSAVGTVTLTFPAGSVDGATQTFDLGVLADTSVEGNETVNLQLGNVTGTGIALGPQTTHSATITNDDTATVEFELAASSNAEASGGNIPQLIVNGDLTMPLTIDVNVTGGTASNGTDFTNGGTVTIPAGNYTGTVATSINLTITDDAIFEGDETIALQLVNPSAGLIIGDADSDTTTQNTCTYTIVDDDMGPAVTSALAEINATVVDVNQVGYLFTYDVLPTINGGDTGVDQITITAPVGYTNFNVTSVSVGGAGLITNCPAPAAGQYCASVAGQDIILYLGTKVTSSLTNINVQFTADTPAVPGSADFMAMVEDSSTAMAPQPIVEGDADGDPSDDNSISVFVILAVSPTSSSVTANPAVVTADGVTNSTITVRLIDDLGNPEPGKTVQIVSDRVGIDTINPVSAVTDANGIATFTINSNTIGVATITATDVTDGIVLTQQAAVSFTQGRVLDLTIMANKDEVVVGDVVTYRVILRNTVASDVTQVRLDNFVPPGFKYLKGSSRLNSAPLADPTGSHTLTFDIGTVPALVDTNGNGQADPGEAGYMEILYQLTVGSSAKPGDYINQAVAKDVCDSCAVSNLDEALITVTLDPIFDLGTIIGKVFNDENRDGWQDPGEDGVAGVMVALDDGTYALTDEYGRYHFPAVKPGHRLLKINLRSLADGAVATTRETVVVWLTPGLLAKANFGVLYHPETFKTGKPPEAGLLLESKAVEQPIQVLGNVENLTVLINGEMASIPSGDIRLLVENLDEVIEIRGNQLDKPVQFEIGRGFHPDIRGWRLIIRNAKGGIIHTVRGSGAPPKVISWNGWIDYNRKVKGGEIYQYQLEVLHVDGSRATSARKLFGINQATAISINLAGGAFITGSAELSEKAREVLKDTAKVLKQYPDEKIIIEGHTDSVGTEEYNLELSKNRAMAALDYLVNEEKLPEDRFVVRWFGESRPLTSNDIPETRALNRRIEIKGQLDKVERSNLLDQYRTESEVRINGDPLILDTHGRFSTQVTDQNVKKFNIEVLNTQGQSFQTTFTAPSIEILKPADQLLLPFNTSGKGYSVSETTTADDLNEQTVLITYELQGRTEPGNKVEIDGTPLIVKPDGTFKAKLELKRGNNPYGIMARNKEGTTRIVNLIVTVNDRDEAGQLIMVTDPVPNLLVQLPPRGVPLTHPLLTIIGVTDLENQVQINGKPAEVEADGTFKEVVKLPAGKSQLEIKAIDPEGRIGVITRPVEVKDTHLFFLAFADGKVGKLKLKNSDSHEEPDDYYTEGRVAFYLKGVVKGKYLVTAALDTGTDEFDQLFKDLDKGENDRLLTNLDPDKFYPVYGDSSTIVYDTESQGNLYLAVDSEEFHLLVGNYQLKLNDTELAAYQRTLYGAKVAYQSLSRTPYGQPDTQVTVFGAEVFQVPVSNELRATGGSLYYLSHRDVIEGSEQVTLVVRDKNTGLVLARLPQQQNVDYTIKYDQGRIVFSRPIASFVEDDTLIDQSLLPGSKVFVEVNYEAAEDSFEATATGGHIRQQIGDHLAVGGTYVKDELSSDPYELQALEAELRLGKNTRIIGEYAESSGTDGQVFVSNDGGLTYGASSVNGTREGNAWKVAAELDIGEWFGYADRYQIGGYFKRLEPGFFSSENFLEEGTEKSGLHLSLKLTDKDKFKARYDQIKTEASGSVNETETDIAVLQWQHSQDWWTLTGEYQGHRFLDQTTNDSEYTNYLAARLSLKPIDTLTVDVEHQQTLTGVENDQTTLGLQYQIHPKLSLDVSGTTGSQGESAYGGATLKLDDDSQVYIRQQLVDDQASRTTSTVVGGEAPIGTSAKIYSEYQWEHRDEDDRNISLLGAERKWEAVKGLDVFLSGELSAIDSDQEDLTRYAVAGGLSYAHPAGLKASTRGEIRREDGDQDQLQFLTVNRVEIKLNPDFTLLGNFRYSETTDEDTDETEASFKEYVIGLAYRPVAFDRFNALAKYTRLDEQGPEGQIDTEPFASKTEVASIEWSFDINRWIEWVEKAAYKSKTEEISGMPSPTIDTFLSISRLNFNIWSQIYLGAEYRFLLQEEADDKQQGWLTELMWEPVEHFRVGAGYNFTDFSDNEFSDNDYSMRGWFLRFQATF
jgi:outer membrane protein OmpA-like peptidoglycan-associated protein